MLRTTSVDTDQIMPAKYLSRLDKTGFEDGLFAGWRKDPEFPLNQPGAESATVLLAGRDFAIGSSREHAVWGLRDWGFRAVFAPSFGDIFRTNAGECGLLCGTMDESDVERMMGAAERDTTTQFTVSVSEQTVRWGDEEAKFELDARAKDLLLSGGDAISMTLQSEAAIAAFEQQRSPHKPTV